MVVVAAHHGAKLVGMNARMCGRGAQFWVQLFPLIECSELSNAGCGEHSEHLKVWVLMESPKGSAIEGSLVIEEKDNSSSSSSSSLFLSLIINGASICDNTSLSSTHNVLLLSLYNR